MHILNEATDEADQPILTGEDVSCFLESGSEGLAASAQSMVFDLLGYPLTQKGSRSVVRRAFTEAIKIKAHGSVVRLSRPIPTVTGVRLDGTEITSGYTVNSALGAVEFDKPLSPWSGVEIDYNGGWAVVQSVSPAMPAPIKEAALKIAGALASSDIREDVSVREASRALPGLVDERVSYHSASQLIRYEIAPLVAAYRWRDI